VPALLETQQEFVRHVRGEDSRVLQWVHGAGLTPAARMAVYRNSYLLNFTDALLTSFPAVARLVGDDFFEGATQRFVGAHPSSYGDLNRYGAGFADFLAHLPEAANIPYLADIARLEWARQEALLAADANPFDPASILPGNERLPIHPSVRLVASQYPVLTLWRYCLEDEPGEPPALNAGSERVLIVRPHDDVLVLALDAGEYVFLDACANGACLTAALACAEESSDSFDLEACLQRHHTAGIFAATSTLGESR